MDMFTYKNLTKKIAMLFVLSILFISNSNAQADSLYSQILKGNKAYTESEFENAVYIYEQVLKSGYTSGELYYNLGNAYYRKGDYTSAILNYERALLLSPNDEDILTNLDFSRNHLQDRIEEIPDFFLVGWFKTFSNLFSAKMWATISIVSFILFLAFAGLFLFSRTIAIRKLTFIFSIIILFNSAISFVGGYIQNRKQTKHIEAIVFSPSVIVKSAPSDSGTDLFIIHEGLKVRIRDVDNGWKEIQLSDGKIGWLSEDTIVEI
ncbi:MAG: hypothetical protein B6I20_04175 [Bacteroidetes bacterium 4572_117]|nr:MAG: hypothetical protein B6I20_04175 [Bacteroidetes bacterium 4572_117]